MPFSRVPPPCGRAGADVIDLGCLPDTPFPPSRRTPFANSRLPAWSSASTSAAAEELRRAAKAGAAFLLSLTEHTLDIARDSGATPVLIPASHGDLASLLRAAEAADTRGISSILDPILDPIHFGFTASLQRYAELRHRIARGGHSDGNRQSDRIDDADSGGVTATSSRHLFGAAASETCWSFRSARIPVAPSRSTTRRGE
jgi:hypothetical protein